MDGRLGSVDLDFGVDVAASARPPIVEPMKARMKTFEAHLIVLLLFVIVVVVVLIVLIPLIIAVFVVAVIVAIAVAAPVIDVPSMVVSLTRRRVTMTTITVTAGVRRRMIVATGDAAVVAGNFAPRYRRANLLD